MIEFSCWGVANRVGDVVVLHEDLRREEWSQLRGWLLEHELGHSSGVLSWRDLASDVRDFADFEKGRELLRFMVSRPRTWVQLLPVFFFKGDVCVDWGHLLLWGVIAVVFWLVWKVIVWSLGGAA